MAGEPTGVVDVDRVADVVSRLRRALRRGARGSFPQEHLSVAQLELLHFVDDQPGARAGELAQALRLAPTTVSTLVSQLLDKKSIERVADPFDRRAWQLYATRGGRRELDRWQEANKQVLREAFYELSVADRRAVERALPALNRLAERLAQAG